jgi:hypothetical protein
VACLLKAKIEESGNASKAGQWLCKCYVTTNYEENTTTVELLEAAFSMQSAATATSHYNKETARRGVFCVFRDKVI